MKRLEHSLSESAVGYKLISARDARSRVSLMNAVRPGKQEPPKKL